MSGRGLERTDEESEEEIRSLTEALAEDFDEDPEELRRQSDNFDIAPPYEAEIIEETQEE